MVPSEYDLIFVARWGHVPAWELDARPDWRDAYEIACAADLGARAARARESAQ